MAQQPVKTLFVTLRRSFAGTRESHIATIKSLGLSYREQTVEVQNRASIRGAIDKVGLLSQLDRCLTRARPTRGHTDLSCGWCETTQVHAHCMCALHA